jgi:hypothetical protein
MVDDLVAIRDVVGREDEHFDYVASGTTAAPTDTDVVSSWEAAGATWWLESLHCFGPVTESMRDRLCAGPPRPQ